MCKGDPFANHDCWDVELRNEVLSNTKHEAEGIEELVLRKILKVGGIVGNPVRHCTLLVIEMKVAPVLIAVVVQVVVGGLVENGRWVKKQWK